jgi:DNA polymerase III epsilon subunit-like protein
MNNTTAWAQAVLKLPNLTFCVIDTCSVEKDADMIALLTLNREGIIESAAYIQPVRTPGQFNTEYTGLTESMMSAASPDLASVWDTIQRILEGKVVLSYNIAFVRRVLNENAEHYGLPPIHIIGTCLQQNALSYFRSKGYPGVHLKLATACKLISYALPERPDAFERALAQFALLHAIANEQSLDLAPVLIHDRPF